MTTAPPAPAHPGSAPAPGWRRWLLWGLLLGGALLVAGFAASLLRKRPPAG